MILGGENLGNVISNAEHYADYRTGCDGSGLDHGFDLQGAGSGRNPEHWSLYHHFQYYCLRINDSASDQTAEILETEFCYAAGNSENSEKVSE